MIGLSGDSNNITKVLIFEIHASLIDIRSVYIHVSEQKASYV